MPSGSQPPDDQPPNGHRPPGLSPLVPGRGSRPSYSLAALRERLEQQFHAETADRADILIELDTEEKRRAMLREVMDYILGIEAITLSPQDRRALLDSTYRSLFTFGPLDDYLADETITEISVNGPHSIHVRRGLGKLEPIPAAFDDRQQLAALLTRVLAGAGIVLDERAPFVETGLMLAGRPARLALIAPPASPDYSLEIRLHPLQPLTLDALPPQAATVLRAIVTAGHGLLIVGDAGTGKTTLAAALAAALPTASIVAVERTAEMHLPPHITRRAPTAPTPGDPGQDFAGALKAALDSRPGWLIVDEIRGDESAAVWDALTREAPPAYLWVFRGDIQPDRLRSALSMVIRRQQPAVEQAAIHRALARHLPFVAALTVSAETPRLHAISEWVLDDSTGDLALRPILTGHDDRFALVNRPTRPLDLPGDLPD